MDNTPYYHNEQFIQRGKAVLFNDDVTAARIMKERNPVNCMRLGDRVKGFIPQRWEKEAPGIAKQGALAKFHQNEFAKKHLLKSGNKKIVEASRDSFWGIGLRLTDPGVLNKMCWNGADIMGGILMDVREVLKAE